MAARQPSAANVLERVFLGLGRLAQRIVILASLECREFAGVNKRLFAERKAAIAERKGTIAAAKAHRRPSAGVN